MPCKKVGVAKLADATASSTVGVFRMGSSPISGTRHMLPSSKRNRKPASQAGNRSSILLGSTNYIERFVNMPRMAKSKLETESSRLVKKLSASENGYGIHYTARSRKEYCISQNTERQRFTLWRIVPGGYEKMSVSNNPYDLYPMAESDA